MKYAAPKGTYDILPPNLGSEKRAWVEDGRKRQWIEGVFRDLCARCGYDEVRTPVFENAELFLRSVGEGTDIVSKEMYLFESRGGDKLALRPEGTAGVLRAYVESRLYIERPVCKMFYIGPNFRYERPQKGRYRQHHQAGLELLGAEGAEADAEVISLALAFFRALGIVRLTVKINSLGTTESRARYVDALRDWAAPLLSEMSDENQQRFAINPLRMLDTKNEADLRLLESAPSLLSTLDDSSRAHFDALCGYLSALNITFEIDNRLVRGFDYYTRTVFEIQSPDLGAQSALGGGGRYNKLVEELGGPATPGIGFGIGIERALIALEAANVSVPDTGGLVAFLCPIGSAARAMCVPLLARLRDNKISCDMDYSGRKLKAMLEQADKVRSKYALIIGDDEVASNTVQLRSMESKVQRAVPIGDLAAVLRDS